MQTSIALEHHFTDLPYCSDFVIGLPKEIIQDGTIAVPEAPGLGIDLNEEVIREHLTLITSSNLVGCSAGRSPGLAPRKILST